MEGRGTGLKNLHGPGVKHWVGGSRHHWKQQEAGLGNGNPVSPFIPSGSALKSQEGKMNLLPRDVSEKATRFSISPGNAGEVNTGKIKFKSQWIRDGHTHYIQTHTYMCAHMHVGTQPLFPMKSLSDPLL